MLADHLADGPRKLDRRDDVGTDCAMGLDRLELGWREPADPVQPAGGETEQRLRGGIRVEDATSRVQQYDAAGRVFDQREGAMLAQVDIGAARHVHSRMSR